MNSNLNPLQTIIIVTVFLTLFGGGFWAYDQAFDSVSVDYTQHTPWGSTFIRTGDLLTEFSADMTVTREIDISELGLFYSWGNFELTNPNTLIVNSLGGNDEQPGLYRCDLTQQQCQPFTTDMPPIRRHWFSTHNNIQNELFISHVSIDKLYRLDANGNLIDVYEDLNQPGTVHLIGDNLTLINTNHRKVLTLNLNDKLKLLSTENIKQQGPQRYPISLIRVKQEWWVNILGKQWQDGVIYRYNNDWELIAQLPMPTNAKPFLLENLGNDVIVTDYVNKRVYHYNAEAKFIGEISTPAMDEILIAARERSAFMMQIVYACATIGALLFIIGIIAGIKRGDLKNINKRQAQTMGLAFDSNAEILEPLTKEYWIPKNPKFLRQFKMLPILIGAVLLTFLGIMFFEQTETSLLMAVIFAVLASTSLIVILMTRKVQQSFNKLGIGITEGYILLRNGKGEQAKVKPNELMYTTRTLVAKNIIVTIPGSPHVGYLFDPDEMKKWIMPRFRDAKAIGEFELLKIMWRIRHPQLMSAIYISIPAIILYAYVTFFIA